MVKHVKHETDNDNLKVWDQDENLQEPLKR